MPEFGKEEGGRTFYFMKMRSTTLLFAKFRHVRVRTHSLGFRLKFHDVFDLNVVRHFPGIAFFGGTNSRDGK